MSRLVPFLALASLVVACADSTPPASSPTAASTPSLSSAPPPAAPAVPAPASPASPPATLASSGDACSSLKSKVEAKVAGGGACTQDSDCVHFSNHYIGKYACGLGITDKSTAGSLASLDGEMEKSGCGPKVAPICPHIMKLPQCKTNRCE